MLATGNKHTKASQQRGSEKIKFDLIIFLFLGYPGLTYHVSVMPITYKLSGKVRSISSTETGRTNGVVLTLLNSHHHLVTSTLGGSIR